MFSKIHAAGLHSCGVPHTTMLEEVLFGISLVEEMLGVNLLSSLNWTSLCRENPESCLYTFYREEVGSRRGETACLGRVQPVVSRTGATSTWPSLPCPFATLPPCEAGLCTTLTTRQVQLQLRELCFVWASAKCMVSGRA